MLRKILVTAGGISLCVLLAALAMPANASSRTLHPNELWAAYGGETFNDRCCDQVGLCTWTMVECELGDPFLGEQDCLQGYEEVQPGQFKDEGCNAGPDGTTCTEDDDDNVCLWIHDCTWDEETGTCGKGVIDDVKWAPKDCNDDCDEEEPDA